MPGCRPGPTTPPGGPLGTLRRGVSSSPSTPLGFTMLVPGTSEPTSTSTMGTLPTHRQRGTCLCAPSPPHPPSPHPTLYIFTLRGLVVVPRGFALRGLVVLPYVGSGFCLTSLTATDPRLLNPDRTPDHTGAVLSRVLDPGPHRGCTIKGSSPVAGLMPLPWREP